MSKIKLGSHVGMAGKEMFLASAKEAASVRGKCFYALYRGSAEYPEKRCDRIKYRSRMGVCTCTWN